MEERMIINIIKLTVSAAKRKYLFLDAITISTKNNQMTRKAVASIGCVMAVVYRMINVMMASATTISTKNKIAAQGILFWIALFTLFAIIIHCVVCSDKIM